LEPYRLKIGPLNGFIKSIVVIIAIGILYGDSARQGGTFTQAARGEDTWVMAALLP
jgi:hypothetical protein